MGSFKLFVARGIKLTLPRLLRTANFKLAMSYALVFGGSVLVLGAIAFFDVRYSLEAQLRMHVKAEIEQLMRDYRDDGIDELRHDVRERMESDAGARLRYSIANADGKVIFDRIDPLPTAKGWHEITRRNVPLLAYSQPLKDGYILTVAADTRPIEAVERAMLHACLLAIFGTFALGIIGGLWMSRRFLRRVDALGRTAEAIGNGDLAQRIATTGTGDDFDQLADSINRMLERIELLVQEVRHVSTSIAHDLRTPLSQLRYKLEAIGEGRAVDEAIALLDETLATFAALMQLAELESAARKHHFAPVPLSELLEGLADAYDPLVILKRNIAPNLQMEGDANLLRQLFANLIENAIKHAGGAIEIALRQEAALVVATVADHGNGIPPERHADVLRPFFRLDESRSSRGSGLGLSLVSAIARLHDATLTLSDNAPGLTVTTKFKQLNINN